MLLWVAQTGETVVGNLLSKFVIAVCCGVCATRSSALSCSSKISSSAGYCSSVRRKRKVAFAILALSDHYFLKDSSWGKRLFRSVWEAGWGDLRRSVVFVVGMMAGWEYLMRWRDRSSSGETCRDVCMFEFAPDNQKGSAFYTIFTTNGATPRVWLPSRKSPCRSVSTR